MGNVPALHHNISVSALTVVSLATSHESGVENPMSRHSPSSRQDYNFCPRYWWLRKRWKSRAIGYPELCAMVGTAVGAAQAQWNTCRMQSKPVTVEELVATGLESFTTQLANESAQDRRVSGLKASNSLDVMPRQVEAAIRLLWEVNPLQHYTILAAEEEYPAYGNARLDVRTRDEVRQVEQVWDYKCKLGRQDIAYVGSALQEKLDGEQGLVYTYMTGTQQFGIILVVLNPHKQGKVCKPQIVVDTKTITPEQHAQWLRDAEMDYSEMTEILQIDDPKRVRGKAYPHTNQYGDCPFKQACLEDDLDPTKMQLYYTQIEKGR